MRNRIFILLVAIILMSNASCVYSMARYDGPYKGKIVDAETGSPIEGVVVLGVWYKETPTVAGGVSSYFEASETVSDKNGDFEIKGLGLKIFSNVTPMNVVIFKNGYQYIDSPWEAFKLDEGLLKKKVAWEGDRAIIPLRKLTMEEIRKRIIARPPGVPDEKMTTLTKEINKERVEEGLSPL